MKLRHVGMILTVAATLGAGSSFAGDADFWLVNKTGYSIREIYISAAHQSGWESDQLGASAMLENNNSRFVKYSDRASCKRNMRVVFDDDGFEMVWVGLDLCEIDKLSVRYDRATLKVTALKE